MSDKEELPEKREVARMLLVKGSVFVHLDPRVQGVIVPDWLRRQPQLVLQVGLDLPVPIPDLEIDEDGVFATLSFNRSAFSCRVPWDAIFALVGDDGKGMVWPNSLPEEIANEVDREAGRQPPPGLRLVPEDGEFEETDPGRSRDRPRRGPQLQRITEPVFESPRSMSDGDERRRPSLSVVPAPEPLPAPVTQLPGTIRSEEAASPSIESDTDFEPPPEDGPGSPPSTPPNLRLIK